MSEFTFLNSLLNPPVIVEDAARTEHAFVEEANRKGGYRSGFVFSLYVTYVHPAMAEELYLVVNAFLNADFASDDNSFGYSYGSESGTHGDIDEYLTDLEWTKVEIPHVADNMNLFKMQPEQVKHITAFVTNYLTRMDEDEIAKLLDVEDLVSEVKRYYNQD